MIKFIILAYVVLVVNCEIKRTTIKLQPELEAIVLKAMDKCCSNKEKKQAIINMVRDGEYRHDQEFKTIIHCIYKESGHIKEDGRLIIEKALAAFPDKATMKKILTECDNDMGQIPEENTYKTFKCFQDTSIYRISLDE